MNEIYSFDNYIISNITIKNEFVLRDFLNERKISARISHTGHTIRSNIKILFKTEEDKMMYILTGIENDYK